MNRYTETNPMMVDAQFISGLIKIGQIKRSGIKLYNVFCDMDGALYYSCVYGDIACNDGLLFSISECILPISFLLKDRKMMNFIDLDMSGFRDNEKDAICAEAKSKRISAIKRGKDITNSHIGV